MIKKRPWIPENEICKYYTSGTDRFPVAQDYELDEE